MWLIKSRIIGIIALFALFGHFIGSGYWSPPKAVIDLREVAASTMQTLTLVLDAKNGLDANTGTGGAEGGRDTNGDLRSDASDTSATGDTFASTATSISSSGGLGITEITETSGGAPFLKAAGKCGRWFHLWRVAR